MGGGGEGGGWFLTEKNSRPYQIAVKVSPPSSLVRLKLLRFPYAAAGIYAVTSPDAECIEEEDEEKEEISPAQFLCTTSQRPKKK